MRGYASVPRAYSVRAGRGEQCRDGQHRAGGLNQRMRWEFSRNWSEFLGFAHRYDSGCRRWLWKVLECWCEWWEFWCRCLEELSCRWGLGSALDPQLMMVVLCP